MDAAPRKKEDLSERGHALVQAIAKVFFDGDVEAAYAELFSYADEVDAQTAEDRRRRGVALPEDVRISLKATHSTRNPQRP